MSKLIGSPIHYSKVRRSKTLNEKEISIPKLKIKNINHEECRRLLRDSMILQGLPSSSLGTLERTTEVKPIRYDSNGVEINKMNKKKIKVAFIDEINPEVPLVDVINVDSYKEYNLDIFTKPFYKLGNNNPEVQPAVCCTCSVY